MNNVELKKKNYTRKEVQKMFDVIAETIDEELTKKEDTENLVPEEIFTSLIVDVESKLFPLLSNITELSDSHDFSTIAKIQLIQLQANITRFIQNFDTDLKMICQQYEQLTYEEDEHDE